MTLDPVCDTLRVRGTDTLQNQRMRLAGAGVAAAHIHQDIITGTVMQRPGLDGLLNALQSGDALVVTALDQLGRDTLGLLELINRLATMGVDLKVLDMPVEAQDVASGSQLVALVTGGVAAIERANISQRTKQGLERARAGGKLAEWRWGCATCWMFRPALRFGRQSPRGPVRHTRAELRPANPSW